MPCRQQLQGWTVVLTRYVSCTAGSNCDLFVHAVTGKICS
jgi:hypothetical protein